MNPITDTFEDRLLDALLDRFDDPACRPAAVNRSARGRPRRYALAAVAVAAAATAAVVGMQTGGPAPVPGAAPPARHAATTVAPAYALAAWTVRPTSASPAQIAGAEARCSAAFGQAAASPPAPDQKVGPPLSGGPWNPLLVDTRGDLTFALYGDGTHWMSCLDGSSFISVGAVGGADEHPMGDDAATLDHLSVREVPGDVYAVAIGQTGAGVTAVGLQRPDGSVVSATVGHGYFIAWWPDGQGVDALSVTTGSGTQTDPVDPQFANPAPQPTNEAVQTPGLQPPTTGQAG